MEPLKFAKIWESCSILRIYEPNHQTNLTDLSFQKFSEALKVIHFFPDNEKDIKQLLFGYRELFKFACSTADGRRNTNTHVDSFLTYLNSL